MGMHSNTCPRATGAAYAALTDSVPWYDSRCKAVVGDDSTTGDGEFSIVPLRGRAVLNGGRASPPWVDPETAPGKTAEALRGMLLMDTRSGSSCPAEARTNLPLWGSPSNIIPVIENHALPGGVYPASVARARS